MFHCAVSPGECSDLFLWCVPFTLEVVVRNDITYELMMSVVVVSVDGPCLHITVQYYNAHYCCYKILI